MSSLSGELSSKPIEISRSSRICAHLRAIALAVAFCMRVYGIYLAALVVPGLALLLVLRQAMPYVFGADASTGLQFFDSLFLRPPFWVSAAALLAPLVVFAGVIWFAINPRSLRDTFTRTVHFGLRHGRMETRLSEPLFKQRLAAFSTFVRAFLVCMPVVAVLLMVQLCALASWGTATALSPTIIYDQASLQALSRPLLFSDHLVYWISVLINFVLVEAPQTFGWSISPLKLQSGAIFFLALNWMLGLTLVFMVAKYFRLAFNWTKHARAYNREVLMISEEWAREQWQQAEAGTSGAVEDEQVPAEKEPPSNEEILSIVPTPVKLQLYARSVLWGIRVGAIIFGLTTLSIALVAVLLLIIARSAISDLGAMSYVTAAGLTVVPAYLCIEIIVKLADRGRFEGRVAGIYGAGMLAALPEPGSSFEDRALHALQSRSLLFSFRSILVTFTALAVIFQCLEAAWITSSVVTVWPGLPEFFGSEQPTFGAIARFWLDMPLDVLLLGAPDIFGFGFSPLSAGSANAWFVTIAFVFKVGLVAEAINLIVVASNAQADPHSQIARDITAPLRKEPETTVEVQS